ncbi:MAG: methionyl-tRNA formyltransferase [Planctomycetota bacterium]|nr:methionyl-tRNA formyltransferase [Planctomycetota bacterium]
MRLVYFGSGVFGLPTLHRLADAHEVLLVVTQPDRPAGRKRRLTPTPIAELAADRGIPTIKPESPNEPAAIADIHGRGAEAFVVIAYAHKLGPDLIGDTFALNLHASLLPKYRGAAPINWAMINGERQTGLSIITLAQTMDAGSILAQRATNIDPMETAGELHDRLAELGPDLVLETLDRYRAGTLRPQRQDDAAATRAPRLSKADGTVSFDRPAEAVRCRVHGLTPWPGCTVMLDDAPLRLLRVEQVDTVAGASESPGVVRDDLTIACNPGAVRLLSVQPPGGKSMTFQAYCNGHDVSPGTKMRPMPAEQ